VMLTSWESYIIRTYWILFMKMMLLLINKEPEWLYTQDTEIIGTLVHALAYHLTTYQWTAVSVRISTSYW
jgi:hypothetical protein